MVSDRTIRIGAGILLGAAAAGHVVAAFEPEHMETQLFFGFFLVAAALQAALALVLLRPLRGSVPAAIAANVFLILLWAVTRVVPVPGEDHAEPVEALGVLVKALEIASLPLLVRLAGRLPRIAAATPRPS